MNNKSKNGKITELSESVAKELLSEYMQKHKNIDARIENEIFKLGSQIKSIEEWAVTGKILNEMYKMLQASSDRHKLLADSILDYTIDKQKMELERDKFNHKTNASGSDNEESNATVSDTEKEHIRNYIKTITGNQ